MLNANAQKWVAALRSGKYLQGQSHLKVTVRHGGFREWVAALYGRVAPVHYPYTEYCCLGIACELYEYETGKLHERPVGDVIQFVNTAGDCSSSALLPEVAEWLGMKPENVYGELARSEALASKNDAGVSFSVIADLIESDPRGLFLSPSLALPLAGDLAGEKSAGVRGQGGQGVVVD